MESPEIPFEQENEKNANLCKGCSNCCRYVAIEIDKPVTESDYDEIRWYLLHKDMYVFIDHDNEWYVQFNTKCKQLRPDGSCNIYERRPQVCKEYSQDNCERYGDEQAEKFLFRTEEEFLAWANKHPPRKKKEKK
ncbi:MAG: YkgJ family cysteine cluster protein [Candidatus Woesearchaeota archaeon]|nr:MAG: YkgJ family cysteine cluster protein [Candidatus Woesearchaeota archaeon]